MSEDETRRAAIRLYDRFTHEHLDRRAFMAELTRIGGGTAAAAVLLSGIEAEAAEPQVAEADPRLRVQTIEWEARAGRRYRGYQAAPAAGGDALPAVMVVHENRGLNDHIRDVTRRLALAGYRALAPDFLSLAGGTPAAEDEARRMIGALDMPETVADGAATIRRLGSEGGARKVGAVGFCWGGGMVNRLAAAAGGALLAGTVFYGPGLAGFEAPRVAAPLLVHLAELDERVNATALPWILALRNAGKDVLAFNHHGADHAFHNDTSPARYHRRAAERAWAETLAFFADHLRQ